MCMIPAAKLQPQQTEAWTLSRHAIHHINSYLGVFTDLVIESRQPDGPFSFCFPGLRLKSLIAPGAPQKSTCEILQALANTLYAFSYLTWRGPCVGRRAQRNNPCLCFASRWPYHITACTTAVTVCIFDILTDAAKEQVLHISATILTPSEQKWTVVNRVVRVYHGNIRRSDF